MFCGPLKDLEGLFRSWKDFGRTLEGSPWLWKDFGKYLGKDLPDGKYLGEYLWKYLSQYLGRISVYSLISRL